MLASPNEGIQSKGKLTAGVEYEKPKLLPESVQVRSVLRFRLVCPNTVSPEVLIFVRPTCLIFYLNFP